MGYVYVLYSCIYIHMHIHEFRFSMFDSEYPGCMSTLHFLIWLCVLMYMGVHSKYIYSPQRLFIYRMYLS